MGDPLAFLLTWTTYGSWLPGDSRGWVDGQGQMQPPNESLVRAARQSMAESVVTLSSEQRLLVEQTIREHSQIRGWFLHAVNCRTQHVHVVVTAFGLSPPAVMNQFKAWCTRRLKEKHTAGSKTPRKKWWTQKGSKRQLFDESALEAAIRYVVEGQEGPKG